MPELLLLAIVTLYGSSSHVPAFPAGAEAFTAAPVTSREWPEVSTNPPLPPPGPPWARKVPWAWVTESGFATADQTLMFPPSPSVVALAFSTAPLAHCGGIACGRGSAPCTPPPTAMVAGQPPCGDDLRALLEHTCWPETCTVPPVPLSELASSVPLFTVLPEAPPSSWMTPPC